MRQQAAVAKVPVCWSLCVLRTNGRHLWRRPLVTLVAEAEGAAGQVGVDRQLPPPGGNRTAPSSTAPATGYRASTLSISLVSIVMFRLVLEFMPRMCSHWRLTKLRVGRLPAHQPMHVAAIDDQGVELVGECFEIVPLQGVGRTARNVTK